MEDKKKSAPGGTPISNQINRTIPKARNQWLAEILLDMISGRDCPLRRPINASIDRELRGLIAEKNAAGEDVIINLGDGYFRPGEEDREAFLEYYRKEMHRIKEIAKKLNTMLDTYTEQFGRYE